MRTPFRYLGLTALGAALAAVCVPACSTPEEESDEVGASESQISTGACPASGGISRGWFNGHDGVDIAAPFGTPIYAVGPGVVTDSGPAQGYGQWIRIRHDDGSMTEYGHMRRRDVGVGARVRAGQQIAAVGSEGQSTGPHLHLRTYRRAGDGRGVDPMPYLRARGISLPCKGGNVSNPAPTQPQTTCVGGKGAVVGKIREKYLSLGGCGSTVLGLPIQDEEGSPDKRGRYSFFEKGAIYWTEATGAWEVHGAIREAWIDLGYELGPLGYPISDEQRAPDGRGRFAVFERGSIYWTAETQAHEVRGSIRDKYKELGWEAGVLGYPTSNEYEVPGGRRSDFEHGSITWTAATGETTVRTDVVEQKDGGAN